MENIKKNNKPRKNSKAWYIEEITSRFDEYKKVHEQLEELHNQGKIEHWVVMVHGLYNDYSYKWFYGLLHEDNKCKGHGTGKKNTTLWYYRYHLERIEEEIRKARKIVEACYATSSTYEEIIEDLRQLGLINPKQIFQREE